VIIAGWINRQQQEVIEYHRTENAVLKEKLGKKRILLSDDQRRRLAVKGKILGRKRLPPRSPNMNAHRERFFGSLKSECLSRLILFREKSMRNAVGQFLFHYHTERPHQGLNNELIVPLEQPPIFGDKIETNERLGGLLRSYRRAA
jgi:transposase InsO family protein